MAEKVRYEVDPHNRLVIKGRKTGINRFRRVLDGTFKASPDNSLTYHIKAPYPVELRAPYQVKLKGNWSLNSNHDLVFTLEKAKRETFGDELVVKGEIISAEKNALLFAVTTQTGENKISTYLLELSGKWQADKNNRLTFGVKRGINRQDILTFDAGWEIDKNHQIVYTYEKRRLFRKTRGIHTLRFKGYWDIKDKFRFSYILDKNTDSRFDFGVSLGVFKEDYIKYELGIMLSKRRRPLRRIIAIPGIWRVNKNLGLLFEVEYENHKIEAITLGAEAKISDNDEVVFKLKNYLNQDIASELKLTHRILKGDGELFLRLLKSKEEAAITAGAGFRW